MNKRKRLIIGLFVAAVLLVVNATAFAIENDSVETGFDDESLTAVEKASSDQSLSKKGSITLDKESYVFKGKAVKPKVVVYYDGRKIKKNKDYTLEFSDNDAIGFGEVKATGKGNYTGSITLEFPIVPQPVKIKKVKKNDSGFDATWKVAKDADGYEIAYGTAKDFSDATNEKIEGNQNTNIHIYNLKPNSVYYIRLRSYKKTSKGNCYSAWSKASKFVVADYEFVKGTYMVVDLSGGTNAVRYPISYLNSVPQGGWSDEYKTTKLVFRLVPAGTFIMGSPDGNGEDGAEEELGRSQKREPQHVVKLSRPFYIAIFELTHKQHQLMMGYNSGDDKFPYSTYSGTGEIRGCNGWPTNTFVSENSLCGQLRARTGLPFDLPTEAQWEYACRAGTHGAWNDGTTITNKTSDGRLDRLGRYQHNRKDGKGGGDGLAMVGSYLPNAWGLYDMHGNMWELCLDRWAQKREYVDGEIDPVGPVKGSAYRVIKGGHFQCDALNCRSAFSTSDTTQPVGVRFVLVQ